MRTGPALLGRFGRLRALLRSRPDSEHEMSLNRVLLISAVLLYLLVATAVGQDGAREMLERNVTGFAFYYAMTGALFLHLLRHAGISPVRRVLGMLLDVGILSYGMHVGNDVTATLFPIYLWIIFGNGFRFGATYLFIAAGIGLAGFGIVVATTPFWQTHRPLGAGLLLGLIVLPAYVSLLIRKLNDALRQAEEASRAKSIFLASVSHELRTPLNAVIGFSELLEDTRLTAAQLEMTRTIGAAGRSLLGLINTLLDFARIEAGQMPLQTTRFDLHALLREVRRMIFVGARDKGVRVSVFIDPAVPRLVLGPERDLREILTNLAGNALKFTSNGHIRLSVRMADPAEASGGLVFEVEDTGIGIAPEAQQRIFERFTQADETIVDRFGGTGLGLSIVKQLVERNGGAIGVRSAPGEGSVFGFDLALAPAAAEAADADARPDAIFLRSGDTWLAADIAAFAAEPLPVVKPDEVRPQDGRHIAIIVDVREVGWQDFVASLTAAPAIEQAPILLVGLPPDRIGDRDIAARVASAIPLPLDQRGFLAALAIAAPARAGSEGVPEALQPGRRSLHVLVAEDNLVNKKLVTRILEVAGHTVTSVSNGEEALQALTTLDVDVALMDVNMPVMNGLEAAKLYRFSTEPSRLVPIIALTADATPDMAEKCVQAGMATRVTKPINRAELLETLDAVTAGTAEAAAGRARPVEIGEDTPVTNRDTQEAIIDLGGEDFLKGLLVDFVAAATRAVHDLKAAARSGDEATLRRVAHSLSSSAGNVGADRIYMLCEAWLQSPPGRDRQEATAWAKRVAEELAAFRAAHKLRAVPLRQTG